jgi:hypothetical protein
MAKRSTRRVVRDEIRGVKLGDPRREARALEIADRLASAPESTLPEAMGDRAAIEALYRHLGSEAVTFEALIEQHVARSARRCAREAATYVVHDTTVCTFSGETERAGLGRVNGAKQGFLAHVSLAVSAEGRRVPLGLVGCEVFTRDGERPIGKGESQRWKRGIDASAERVGKPERLIHLADRESDMWWLLAALLGAGHRFILRAKQDRLVIGEDKELRLLFETAREARRILEVDVPLSPRRKTGRNGSEKRAYPPRDARLARLAFAARTVTLRKPRRGAAGTPKTLTVNIVHVIEPDPPQGEKAIEWLLLTTEPIGSDTEVLRVLEGYRTRWMVEEYFKTVKTGCAFESRQLESFKSLTNLFAYALLLSYGLLLMRALARTEADESSEVLLSPDQILCLGVMTKSKPKKLASARAALDAIAKLGVHLPSNGLPGWRVLSRGLKRLLDFESAYQTMRKAGLVINR